jgi:hypothetical protein
MVIFFSRDVASGKILRTGSAFPVSDPVFKGAAASRFFFSGISGIAFASPLSVDGQGLRHGKPERFFVVRIFFLFFEKCPRGFSQFCVLQKNKNQPENFSSAMAFANF